MIIGNTKRYISHLFVILFNLVVAGTIIVILTLAIGDIEQGMSSLASLLPLSYAFGAGMVATVNPCGFIMLPAFVGYYIGTSDTAATGRHEAWARLLRGGKLVTGVTGGFVVLFSVTGLAISLGARLLVKFFPIAGMLLGIGMLILGVWLFISRRGFGIVAASRIQRPLGSGFWSQFLFGIAYGVASLACTLPVFLVVVGGVLSTQSVPEGLLVFIGYALGMGVMLAAVVVGAALFRNAVGNFLRRFLPRMHQLNAVLLFGAGMYLIIYYWRSYGNIWG